MDKPLIEQVIVALALEQQKMQKEIIRLKACNTRNNLIGLGVVVYYIYKKYYK